MTKTFIALLLVIVATHALPDLARLRGFTWLRDVLAQSATQARSVAARLWLPAVLIVATALVHAALHARWLGLLEFAFMVFVLYLSWGPRDLDADIDAVLKAPDSERRTVAAQALNADTDAGVLAFTAPALVEASFRAALSRHFGVMFWFVIAGPTGAIAYRLVHLLARSPAFRDAVEDAQPHLERAARVLDWAPAHLLAWSVAVVSDFDAVARSWRDYHAAHGKGYFTLDLGFLAVIARAGVDADVVAEDGSTADALAELADARVILRRVLVAWLAVIGVIVIGGWAG
jgi:AmpE protein